MSFRSLCLRGDRPTRRQRTKRTLLANQHGPIAERHGTRGTMVPSQNQALPSKISKRSKTVVVSRESRGRPGRWVLLTTVPTGGPKRRWPWRRRPKVAARVRVSAKQHGHTRTRIGPRWKTRSVAESARKKKGERQAGHTAMRWDPSSRGAQEHNGALVGDLRKHMEHGSGWIIEYQGYQLVKGTRVYLYYLRTLRRRPTRR